MESERNLLQNKCAELTEEKKTLIESIQTNTQFMDIESKKFELIIFILQEQKHQKRLTNTKLRRT